jgi:hypothetical protein
VEDIDMANSVDVDLARDLGILAGQESMKKMVEVIDRLPTMATKFAASAVAVAYIEYKIAGLRQMGGPNYNRAIDLATAVFNAAEPVPEAFKYKEKDG